MRDSIELALPILVYIYIFPLQTADSKNEAIMKADDSKDLIIAPVPALVAVLFNREKHKGAALTEEEVLDIRDNAACIVMDQQAYRAVSEGRGYDDIDPERVWSEWLSFKASFFINGDLNLPKDSINNLGAS